VEPRHRVFGIRHHGPGSARSLVGALTAYEPQAVLVEGPPEADEALLHLAADAAMQPPVALLVHGQDEPRFAAYYPMACFSPEWQALQFGLGHGVPTAFMDLPVSHGLALDREREEGEEGGCAAGDPLQTLAELAGWEDGEAWWNQLVEERRSGDDIFPAVAAAMAAMRQVQDEERAAAADGTVARPGRRDLREAAMRLAIRDATKRHERVAVVCGAYHAPALQDLGAAKDDKALLKGLPKMKVRVTWTPWTYDRLTWSSGYGAGIRSPEWYHMLWTTGQEPTAVAARFLAATARLLRDEGLDASSAHIIEALRLAEALAALRGRPIAGLDELLESVRTVMCFGGTTALQLVSKRLVVGDRMGEVPEDTPQTPLQRDFAGEAKRLRMQTTSSAETLDLDLRKPLLLDRSLLLHRMQLLGVPWGKKGEAHGKKGSFHEVWNLEWDPGFAILLVEASVWGTTVHGAAAARARGLAADAPTLPAVTALLEAATLASLPEAVVEILAVLQAKAAVAADVTHLMAALPRLVDVVKYGSVRNTDTASVAAQIDGIAARVCVGLGGACRGVAAEAAAELLALVIAVEGALFALERDELLAGWRDALAELVDDDRVHGSIRGRAVRILRDGGRMTTDEAGACMHRALSKAQEPALAAAWLEGFLSGSGTVLLHDDALLGLIDSWLGELGEEHFTAALPLLRRTFSTFPFGERRRLGQKVRGQGGPVATVTVGAGEELDEARANLVVPTLRRILGVEP